jgi:hypothetical protein
MIMRRGSKSSSNWILLGRAYAPMTMRRVMPQEAGDKKRLAEATEKAVGLTDGLQSSSSLPSVWLLEVYRESQTYCQKSRVCGHYGSKRPQTPFCMKRACVLR